MIEKLKQIYGKFFFFIFSFFPLQNKIVFSSFQGKNYEGNPKVISDYLLENRKDIKQVWLNVTNKQFELSSKIKQVKYGSIKMIYEMATAKVWVDSHRKTTWIKKRKNQLYIETWHGGLGMKKVGKDARKGNESGNIENTEYNSKIADLFISNSTHFSNVSKTAFGYTGKILECGFPKSDIFYQSKDKLNEIRIKALNRLNISLNKKIFLYAPTYRDTTNIEMNLSNYDIDFNMLNETLNKKFNNEFVILFKLHPFIKVFSKEFSKNYDNILDVSDYSDMQELIIATDVFITDYSSGIFDFATLRRPGFLYCKDIDVYQNEVGLYFDLKKEMPFLLAENNEELKNNILNFDYDQYKEKLEAFFVRMGLVENPNSVKEISDIIEKYVDTGNIDEITKNKRLTYVG